MASPNGKQGLIMKRIRSTHQERDPWDIAEEEGLKLLLELRLARLPEHLQLAERAKARAAGLTKAILNSRKR